MRMGPNLNECEETLHEQTVRGFGEEWRRFDFSGHSEAELDACFDDYFSEFPWAGLPDGARGFDAGCGSGRWAERVLPRVGFLHCVDASHEAISVAEKKLTRFGNCALHTCDLGQMPIADGSMDFGYSLGVLHHLPNPVAGLRSCVRKLKPGAPLLVYFYYALDGRSFAFRLTWRLSDILRRGIARLPFSARYAVSQMLAVAVYLPLARCSAIMEKAGVGVEQMPLSAYRNRSFYVMRNDALDRFGTRLESRWSRSRLEREMVDAGLEQIVFRQRSPYWCAVGFRAGGG